MIALNPTITKALLAQVRLKDNGPSEVSLSSRKQNRDEQWLVSEIQRTCSLSKEAGHEGRDKIRLV